jgi:Myb-like DNA-binding protein
MLAGNRQPKAGVEPLMIVLDAIADVGQVMTAAETDVLVLIAEAYFRGASWAEIARRLDRTKQSVHQRYHRRIHAPRTRELLAGDLTNALERARRLRQHDPADEVVAESHTLLREWAASRPTAGPPPGGRISARASVPGWTR